MLLPKSTKCAALTATGAVFAMLAKTAAAEACGEIAEMAANATASPFLSSELALACLKSMPFNFSLAVSFLDEYMKYVEWQSTLEALDNPPPGYLSPPVDVKGELHAIRTRALDNGFESQYDFDVQVFDTVSSANDGHFTIGPCSFSVMTFGLQTPLVSISHNAWALPKLYTLPDALAIANGSARASPVSLINGVGAEAMLQQMSSHMNLQDPDARYNSMLANLLIDGRGTLQEGVLTHFQRFPGFHSFNLTHANGTQTRLPVIATINSLPDGFTAANGEALWEQFCAPQNHVQTPTKRANGPPSELLLPSGYPVPVLKDPFNLLIGYFLSDPGVEDTAVLSVPTFLTSGPLNGGELPQDTMANFAIEAQKFVDEATQAGKTKVIIDLSNNGGGMLDSGLALLSVFFPNKTIDVPTRFRSVNATRFVVDVFNSPNNPDRMDTAGTIFDVSSLVRPDGSTHFASPDAFMGPFHASGIPSTALFAVDNFQTINPVIDPINVDGRGGQLNGTTPPFPPKNIVILTDGRCSSTCAVFADRMIAHGVRSVAVGGRPQLGPMQTIGGVRGAQDMELDSISAIYDKARTLVAAASRLNTPIFPNGSIPDYVPVPVQNLSLHLPFASINFRNSFASPDGNTPLQFVYKAADCRLFYTAESLVRPASLWAEVAKATWGRGKCASHAHFGNSTMPRNHTSFEMSGHSNHHGRARTALNLLLGLAPWGKVKG